MQGCHVKACDVFTSNKHARSQPVSSWSWSQMWPHACHKFQFGTKFGMWPLTASTFPPFMSLFMRPCPCVLNEVGEEVRRGVEESRKSFSISSDLCHSTHDWPTRGRRAGWKSYQQEYRECRPAAASAACWTSSLHPPGAELAGCRCPGSWRPVSASKLSHLELHRSTRMTHRQKCTAYLSCLETNGLQCSKCEVALIRELG